jgi:putative hydrolase of the HAD superfamily
MTTDALFAHIKRDRARFAAADRLAAQPEAVFFDLDGTILDGATGTVADRRATCEEACRRRAELEVDTLFAALEASIGRFWADRDRARHGRIDIRIAVAEIYHDALRDLGVDDRPLAVELAHFYRDRRDAALQPYPGAIETLRRLRSQGTRTALLTNGGAIQQRERIARFGLTSLFDCIVIEGEFGAGKPDERVFRHAMQSLSCTADATWMIGDNLEADIAPALALGMHAVWVDGAGGGLPAGVDIQPHRIVRAISELL